MVFYHKGLRVRKTPLPFVACARKAAILHVQIWSEHESDVVGLMGNYPCEWISIQFSLQQFRESSTRFSATFASILFWQDLRFSPWRAATVGTPVTRRPPCRPGRAVFPPPVPRLHSLPRQAEPLPA